MATAFDRTRNLIGAIHRGDYDENPNAEALIMRAFLIRQRELRNREHIEDGDTIVIDGLGGDLDGLEGTATRNTRNAGMVTINFSPALKLDDTITDHFMTSIALVRLVAKAKAEDAQAA